MTTDAFLLALRQRLPEANAAVAEHLDESDGEGALYLLVGDVRRLTLTAWERGDKALAERSLALLDEALLDGDGSVKSAVAVSFVEDADWWDDSVAGFIATWPPALAAEVERQRSWRG